MLRVSHVITGLGVGGAEMMLVKLVNGIDRTRFQSHVVALSSEASLAGRVRDNDIPIDVLDIEPSTRSSLRAVARVSDALRAAKPDLVQTWLYHADLIGGIAATRLGLPTIWNVQTSNLDPAGMSRRTIRVVKLCALASRFLPDTIVTCSQVAIGVHTALGYRGRFEVIPNGTELGVFRPDPIARREVRAEFGLGEATPVIGMVARFHPQKDHANLLLAAADLITTHPEVRFLLCGLGLEPDNEELMALIRRHGVENHVILMGLRFDVPRVLAALDIKTLSSAFGEGFPNVLGEAMAAGLPGVVTDVGDSGMIVGNCGVTVPPRDPAALAEGWRRLLDLPQNEFSALRSRARARIAEKFSLPASIAAYQALYERVVGNHARTSTKKSR